MCAKVKNITYLKQYNKIKVSSTTILKEDHKTLSKKAGRKKSDRRYGSRSKGVDHVHRKTATIDEAIDSDGEWQDEAITEMFSKITPNVVQQSQGSKKKHSKRKRSSFTYVEHERPVKKLKQQEDDQLSDTESEREEVVTRRSTRQIKRLRELDAVYESDWDSDE